MQLCVMFSVCHITLIIHAELVCHITLIIHAELVCHITLIIHAELALVSPILSLFIHYGLFCLLDMVITCSSLVLISDILSFDFNEKTNCTQN